MKTHDPTHFLILGATGPSGLRTVELALARKHTLTLYVRSPEKLTEDIRSHPSVTIVQGQLDDQVAFESCFLEKNNVGPIHGVISVLGPARGQPSGNPITAGYEILLRLLHKYNIRRLVLLSTVSVSSPKDHFSLTRETLVAGIKVIGYTAWTDVVATGKLVRSEAAAGLDITLARVPTLNDFDQGSLKVGFVGDGKTGWQLSRKDLAIFFVDEGEHQEWSGAAPLISS